MSLYILRGTAEARWLPTIADPDMRPTIAEWTAGQPLSLSITALEGLDPQTSKVNVPIMKKLVEEQIDGPVTFQDAALIVVEDNGKGTSPEALERQQVLTVLVQGVDGYLAINRVSQDIPEADDEVWVMAGTVSKPAPSWDLGASAATRKINLAPATDMTPVKVKAA